MSKTVNNLVGFEVFTAVVMKSIIFWDMTPCSLLSFNLLVCHLLACWFAEPISSTLKMEAIRSSEMSNEAQRTTQRHIPEYYSLHEISCTHVLYGTVLFSCVFWVGK
jgi:hypothetical protein